MASFRKRNNKWEARVRRQGNKAICKTFTNIEDAKRWAREQESKLDKGIFEDLTAANNILLKDLINCYIKEVVVNKKSYQSERYKAQKLCKHKIARLKLIMNDFSKSRRRCEEVFKANGEQPKYPHVDYEEMRKIVQDNFGYLGVKVREWKRKNT